MKRIDWINPSILFLNKERNTEIMDKFYVEIRVYCYSGVETIGFMLLGMKDEEEVRSIFEEDKHRMKIFVQLNIPIKTECKIKKIHSLLKDGPLKSKVLVDRKIILNLSTEREIVYGLLLKGFTDEQFNEQVYHFFHVYDDIRSIQILGNSDIDTLTYDISVDMGYMIPKESRAMISMNQIQDISSIVENAKANTGFIVVAQGLSIPRLIQLTNIIYEFPGYYTGQHKFYFYTYDEIRKEVYKIKIDKDLTISRLRGKITIIV